MTLGFFIDVCCVFAKYTKIQKFRDHSSMPFLQGKTATPPARPPLKTVEAPHWGPPLGRGRGRPDRSLGKKCPTTTSTATAQAVMVVVAVTLVMAVIDAFFPGSSLHCCTLGVRYCRNIARHSVLETEGSKTLPGTAVWRPGAPKRCQAQRFGRPEAPKRCQAQRFGGLVLPKHCQAQRFWRPGAPP